MTTNPAPADQLALIRTDLANERTLLAWLRTSLSLLGAGAALLHWTDVNVEAWGIIGSGIAVFLIGAIRYRRARLKLRQTFS